MTIEEKILEAFNAQSKVSEALSEVTKETSEAVIILVGIIEKMEARIKELEKRTSLYTTLPNPNLN